MVNIVPLSRQYVKIRGARVVELHFYHHATAARWIGILYFQAPSRRLALRPSEVLASTGPKSS